jgi:autotransporter translocation and assembly factor TamB
MQVRGTFDQPQLSGTVQILGGEYLFNGNRYFVRESFIDFTDPARMDPFFDVAAETRARSSGQTFTVNVRITGTLGRLDLSLTSDPWLPDSDVVTLLFGGAPNLGTAEQRALGSSQEMQQRMVQTAGAALLTSPLTSRVGEVFERTGALDTVQITPLLTNETAFQQLNPSARITLGKRISPRVFLTYSRTLNAAQEEIILLEYDQSDRLSWVLSRNEDRTFALDFRLRYVF